MKKLLLLFIALLTVSVGTAQKAKTPAKKITPKAQLTGFGKLQLGMSLDSIPELKGIEGEIQDYGIKFTLPKYSITDLIELSKVELYFYHNQLYKIHSELNYDLVNGLIEKYGGSQNSLEYPYDGLYFKFVTNSKTITATGTAFSSYYKGRKIYVSEMEIINEAISMKLSELSLKEEAIRTKKLQTGL